MQKMNRKSVITSIVLIVFMMIPVCLYSVTVSTKTYTAIADFTFREAEIYHTPLNNVLPQQGFVNLKFNVDFGDYRKVEKAELSYYFGGDTSNIYTVANSDKVINRRDFFMKTDAWVESSSISYQVRVTLKMQNGSVGYAYWPEQLNTSSDTFHTAMISNSTSTTVDGEGGSVDLEDGDQSTGNSGVDLFDDIDLPLFFDLRDLISPAPNSSTNVTITQLLYDELNDSPSLWGKVVNGISVEVNPENSQKGMRVRISIKNKTVMNKFVVVYRKNNSIPWAEGRVLKIEKVEDGVVSAIVPRISGQFAVFESTDLDDSDYRPQKRVKVKSRIASGKYTGFEFKGLKEGDVIKIYNVSGKKIAEITEISLPLGIAYWDGRKGTNNSGDWAESGTYIYQIKLKEKNKIVSGTIAFVW